MDLPNEEIVTLDNGNIVMWVAFGTSVHLKCITKYGNPVELNAEEVFELCEVLQRFAKQIE